MKVRSHSELTVSDSFWVQSSVARTENQAVTRLVFE